MIEQVKKIAEQVEENESKKLLLEAEITHLEEVLRHGVSSRFAEENAIYIYSPKTGHEIRKKLEGDYKLMHSKLSIPKKIAEELDKVPFHNPIAQLSNKDCDLTDFNDTVKRYAWNNKENGYICVAYLAGKALGVELVSIEED